MKTRHVVIDLETLSTRKYAVITSIGAVKVVDNKVVDEFKINIDPVSAKAVGLHISKDTIEWWSKQSKEARDSWQKDAIDIREALEKFSDWYGTQPDKYMVWGYGANFDVSILESSFQAVNMKEPWPYYNVMCLRTIANLSGVPVPRLEGTHHDALDDARNQANYLISFLKNV